MNIIPMTAEEALEYAPKAALLDFDGPITPDLIAALRDHLSYAISALAAVSAKLYEAEAAIVDLHTSNLELASLLQRHVEGSGPKLRKSMQNLAEIVSNGGIDPEYGTQLSLDDVEDEHPDLAKARRITKRMRETGTRKVSDFLIPVPSFEDVPSREPIEIITHGTVEEEMLANHHFRCAGCGKIHQLYVGDVCPCGEPFPQDCGDPHWRGPSTVEFRTDPGTYDANRGEIHRMLAEEIVAQFGNQPGADPEPEPS